MRQTCAKRPDCDNHAPNMHVMCVHQDLLLDIREVPESRSDNVRGVAPTYTLNVHMHTHITLHPYTYMHTYTPMQCMYTQPHTCTHALTHTHIVQCMYTQSLTCMHTLIGTIIQAHVHASQRHQVCLRSQHHHRFDLTPDLTPDQ